MTWALLEYTEAVAVAPLDQSQVSGREQDENTAAVFDEEQLFELMWADPGARSEMVTQALGGMVDLSAADQALFSEVVGDHVRVVPTSTWTWGTLPPGAL